MGEASDSVWTEEPDDPMCKTLWVVGGASAATEAM